ncbi:MAG: proteasome assembly chaperone family protein [Thermoplasmataceae archaeon]
MEKIVVNEIKIPVTENPILIGGLPGIGNVGKIAADYLIDKLSMEKICDIFSQYLPPQIFIDDEGVTHLSRNSLYYAKIAGNKEIIIVTGDFQGTTQEGQYELSYKILEIAKKLNVNLVYTMGGYSTGRIVEKPRVLGAVTDKKLKSKMIKSGVVFPKGEPGGGIVGSAGIILGLSQEIFGMEGGCLMGETSGYFADPKGAKELVKVLTKLLGIKVDVKDLEARSKQIEQITEKMQEEAISKGQRKEDLGYFG